MTTVCSRSPASRGSLHLVAAWRVPHTAQAGTLKSASIQAIQVLKVSCLMTKR